MTHYAKEWSYYEDLYNRLTVESARRGMTYYDEFYANFEKKLPPSETVDRPGNAFVLNVFYMETVGNELLRRYEEKERKISEWIERDKAKDSQIASARLIEEPLCRHCGKQGLRITDKDLMHHSDDGEQVTVEDVLFTLKCPYCERYSAYWEDGTAWIVKPIVCPKCGSEMTHKTTKTKTAITFSYSCSVCTHAYKDKIDLKDKKEKVDSEYATDRDYFCLRDAVFRERLTSMRRDFLGMAQLGKEMREKRDNKHIYDAIKEIKKPKIAELSNLLSSTLSEAGYIEVTLDKPQIGKEVIVGFSCLDNVSSRSDYESEKLLKRTVNIALESTNWRLMSDGIHYRLGYLSGRLKAYEHEEDLKSLILKTKKPNIEAKFSGSSQDKSKPPDSLTT